MNAVKEAPKPKTTNGAGISTPAVGPLPTAPEKAFPSPFTFVSRFAEEMDRLFGEFGVEAGWHVPSLFTPVASCCVARPDWFRPSGRRGSR